jgi:uracil phosphoribosyltransferase
LALKQNHVKGLPLPDSLHQLEETQQMQLQQTIIRNRETTRDDFIFYSNRLMRLLIEYALSLLPFDVRFIDICSFCKQFSWDVFNRMLQ